MVAVGSQRASFPSGLVSPTLLVPPPFLQGKGGGAKSYACQASSQGVAIGHLLPEPTPGPAPHPVPKAQSTSPMSPLLLELLRNCCSQS